MSDEEFDLERQTTKQYSLPNGRTIHICPTPDSAEQLRQELAKVNTSGLTDVYVQSTPEHLETLRAVQAQHRQKHDEIRQKHRHVFDQLDPITDELDALAAELSLVTNQHISLDANFDRFGYAAHIRIRQEDDTVTSGPASQADSGSSLSQASKYKPIRFWKKPVVRQYFYRGLLWRASESEEVAAYELFFDLLYVGIIAAIGDAAASKANGEALLEFVITFFGAYKIWGELVLIVQWFDHNDIVQRITIILVGTLLVGYSTNISSAFESTYTPLIAFYVAARSLLCMCFGIVIPAALWIVSIHVEYPYRLGVIWVAILLDMFDRTLHILVMRSKALIKNGAWQDFADAIGTTPAINIEHRTERQNAFVTLIFGYMAVNLLYQHSGKSSGMNSFYGKAVLGLITAFCFNWIYFEIDNRGLEMHAIRRSGSTCTLAKLVVAHDCPDAYPEQLIDSYAEESDDYLQQAHRWFYSSGLGIALACMAGIAATHCHRNQECQRLKKSWRLILRLIISAIMIIIPVAGNNLNSIELIGIDTALVVLVLSIDLWGSSPSNESFWRDDSSCSYSAECRLKKTDFDAMNQEGEVNITKLVEKDMMEKKGVQEPI